MVRKILSNIANDVLYLNNLNIKNIIINAKLVVIINSKFGTILN